MLNKWKNYFSEMKGDVGMSPHEREGGQEDAYTKKNSFIIPSLHLCFFLICICCMWMKILQACKILCLKVCFYTNKDVGMGL